MNILLFCHSDLLEHVHVSCRLSYTCRDASLEVQLLLWKKQEDNLKQSKKPRNTISTFFYYFLCLHAQKRVASVDLLGHGRTRASAYQCLQVQCGFRKHYQHRKTTRITFDIWLCKHRSTIAFFFFFFCCRSHNESGPNPSHMKVLSFVRDVWNFEMTPNRGQMTSQNKLEEKKKKGVSKKKIRDPRKSRGFIGERTQLVTRLQAKTTPCGRRIFLILHALSEKGFFF